MALTICVYCKSKIWIDENLDKLVKDSLGKVKGIICPVCGKEHPAPKTEDWFE